MMDEKNHFVGKALMVLNKRPWPHDISLNGITTEITLGFRLKGSGVKRMRGISTFAGSEENSCPADAGVKEDLNDPLERA